MDGHLSRRVALNFPQPFVSKRAWALAVKVIFNLHHSHTLCDFSSIHRWWGKHLWIGVRNSTIRGSLVWSNTCNKHHTNIQCRGSIQLNLKWACFKFTKTYSHFGMVFEPYPHLGTWILRVSYDIIWLKILWFPRAMAPKRSRGKRKRRRLLRRWVSWWPKVLDCTNRSDPLESNHIYSYIINVNI